MLFLSMGWVTLWDNKDTLFPPQKPKFPTCCFCLQEPCLHQLQVPSNDAAENKKAQNIINITSHLLLASLLFPATLHKWQQQQQQQQRQKELHRKREQKICSRWYSATCASLNHLPHHWEEGRELSNSSETDQRKCRGSGLNIGGQRWILLLFKSLHCSGWASNPSLTTPLAHSSNDSGAVQSGISINEN